MGDFTASGYKIGTLGRAYYATHAMLKKLATDPSETVARQYTEVARQASFAFPYPQWDGREAGEISCFHDQSEERPLGLPPFYVPFDGPFDHSLGCSNDGTDGNGSVYRPYMQQMTADGVLATVIQCAECRCTKVLGDMEALAVSNWIVKGRYTWLSPYPIEAVAIANRMMSGYLVVNR